MEARDCADTLGARARRKERLDLTVITLALRRHVKAIIFEELPEYLVPSLTVGGDLDDAIDQPIPAAPLECPAWLSPRSVG